MGGGRKPLHRMKTKINPALLLAAGSLTSAVLASPSTATFAPASVTSPATDSSQIPFSAHLPSVAELARDAQDHDFALNPIFQLPREVSFADLFGDEQDQTAPRRSIPDARDVLAPPVPSTVVYSMPPSPAFYYTPTAPAAWFPSVTFRLGLDRKHRT